MGTRSQLHACGAKPEQHGSERPELTETPAAYGAPSRRPLPGSASANPRTYTSGAMLSAMPSPAETPEQDDPTEAVRGWRSRAAARRASPRILRRADFLEIAPHRRHRVEWAYPGVPPLRLVVHFD